MRSDTFELFVKKDKNSDNIRKIIMSNHYSNKVLNYKVVENGYILICRKWTDDFLLEGGVVDSKLCYIPGTGYTDTGGCSYEFNALDVEFGRKCIFLGTFHAVYGHAITDNLKRLWFLNTELGRALIDDPSVDVVYITSNNMNLPQWHKRIFELAGVDTTRLKHVRSVTKYDEIIIPDNSIFIENDVLCYTNEYRDIIEKIKGSVKVMPIYKSIPSQKLYYTRTALKSSQWREIGEKSIEKFFEKQGFKIYSPEKLPIEEQICLLMKCKMFAATEGSCSHASVFCNSKVEVIVLRKANYVNLYTTMIMNMVGHRTIFIDVHHSIMTNPKAPMVGPFYLYKSESLYSYFRKDYYVCPLWLRPKYLMYRYSIKSKYYQLRAFLGIRTKIRLIKSLVRTP